MKIKHLYLLVVTTLLLACGEDSKDNTASKQLVDVAVNTDEIKDTSVEYPLSQSNQEAQSKIVIPKDKRKINIRMRDSSSQTSPDTPGILPKLFKETLAELPQDDDLESCSSVATEPSPRIMAEPYEESKHPYYSDAGTQSLPLELLDVGTEALTMPPVDGEAQTFNPEEVDATTQANYVSLPESFSGLSSCNNQTLLKQIMHQVQERSQEAYMAYTSKSYNDFIAAIKKYKEAHKTFKDIQKAISIEGDEKTSDELSDTFQEHYPFTLFDGMRITLNENFKKLYSRNTHGRYIFLENIVSTIIEKFEGQYVGEYAEYDSICDIVRIIKHDFFQGNETSGIKSKIKAGNLEGVVRQLSLFLVEKLNIVLIEDGSKGEGGAYSLSEINAILAAPEDTHGGVRNIPGLAGRPYPYFQEGALLWFHGKRIHVDDFEELKLYFTLTAEETIKEFLLKEPYAKVFFRNIQPLLPFNADQLLAITPNDMSMTLPRTPRMSLKGSTDFSMFNVNGTSGQSIDLSIPLFVHLKGNVSSTKTTEAIKGSVAYNINNTIFGAIQSYANNGEGFGVEGRQLETSIVLSHSFKSFFVETQASFITANQVHNSEWNGYRSQVTLGFDAAYVTPFMQVSYRKLDCDESYTLKEMTGYVGIDMELVNLTADAYSLNTRVLAKAGYGEQNWSMPYQEVGTAFKMKGSVEWNARLNLRSGISFCTSLTLNTGSADFAELKVSFEG